MGSILIRFLGEEATEGIAGGDDAEAGWKFGEWYRTSQAGLDVGWVLHGPSRGEPCGDADAVQARVRGLDKEGDGFGYPDGVGHSGKLGLVEAVGALLSWL